MKRDGRDLERKRGIPRHCNGAWSLGIVCWSVVGPRQQTGCLAFDPSEFWYGCVVYCILLLGQATGTNRRGRNDGIEEEWSAGVLVKNSGTKDCTEG